MGEVHRQNSGIGMIVAILGRPGVGKTTFANSIAEELGLWVVHTDDYIGDVSFEDTPLKIIADLRDMRSYIVEGVQVARMLRYGQRHGIWRPDKLYVIDANIEVKTRHKGMASLCESALAEWIAEYGRDDVTWIYRDGDELRSYNTPSLFDH